MIKYKRYPNDILIFYLYWNIKYLNQSFFLRRYKEGFTEFTNLKFVEWNYYFEGMAM